MTTVTSITPERRTLNAGLQSELNRIRAGLHNPAGAAQDVRSFAAAGMNGVGVANSFAGYLALARETFNSNGADGTVNEIKNAEDILRAGARELVATVFLAPLFKMIREDPLKAEIVPLSAGEKMFAPMLHAAFAKEITAKGNFPLVEAIVKSLLRTTQSEPNSNEATVADQSALTTASGNDVDNLSASAASSRRSAAPQQALKQRAETVDDHG